LLRQVESVVLGNPSPHDPSWFAAEQMKKTKTS
jgi:hypothetical protein